MESNSAPKAEEMHNKGEGEQPCVAIQEPTQSEEAVAPLSQQKDSEPEVKAKTGRAKRREKRLRHEPQNVTGERLSSVLNYMHVEKLFVC